MRRVARRRARPCAQPRARREWGALAAAEQADAANDLLAESNRMPRDEADARCAACDTAHDHVAWGCLELACRSCGAKTALAPAAPILQQHALPGDAPPASLIFCLHCEGAAAGGQLRTLLADGGVYVAQWRELSTEEGSGGGGGGGGGAAAPKGGAAAVGNDGWHVGDVLRPSTPAYRTNLATDRLHQVRVRARLEACGCGAPPTADGVRACLARGDCAWTPWSPPSVPVPIS
mgnify:FL=1